MKKKSLIILVVLLLNVAAFSQNSQRNKQTDSVKVSVKDMDSASLKMIEGKKIKEKFTYITGALSACDTIKFQLKDKIILLETKTALLTKQNENLNKIVEDVKIIAKNEKSAGLRRGFMGLLKGFVLGAIVTSAVLIVN